MPMSSASYTVCLLALPKCLCIVARLVLPLYRTAAAPTPPSMSEPSEYTHTLSVFFCSSSMAVSLFYVMIVFIFEVHFGSNQTIWMFS